MAPTLPQPGNATTHRGYAKAKITRVHTYLEEHPLNTGVSIQQYETRLEMLESAFKDFDKYHNMIQEEEEQALLYYIAVEELYLDLKCILHRLMNENNVLI